MNDLSADGFRSKDWHDEFMQDDTHCFDCGHLLDECECDEEANAWLVENFGEDGLH